MKGNKHKLFVLLLSVSSCFIFSNIKAQKSYDSLNIKTPKHYFNTVFELDGYNKPSVKMDTSGRINKHLKTYGIKQFNLSFYIPLYTEDYRGKGKDSNVIANSHLLLIGNFLRLEPQFDGISQHTLTKRGIGLRYIYNTGKKGVWFFDAAPFVTRDITYTSRAFFRMAGTAVYSHNFSDKFNCRIGYTKSFLWGNRLRLPFIGLRVGKLDKVNFSFQFPRSMSLNIPMGSKFRMSLYTRPQGGVFNFSNHDTIYPKSTLATFHFTRYEINTGLRFDMRLGSHFSLFLSGGLSTNNNVFFYSDAANKNSKGYYSTYFFNSKTANTFYIQYGLVLKFGKTRSYFNNRNIYDAIDLNSGHDINDNNSQIPSTPLKAPKNPNLESIQDLIDYNDF